MASATTSSFSSSSNPNGADKTTTINKKGNVATFQSNPSSYQTGLTAIDTYGNTFKVPDYTIKDILSAIPSHCYERRLLQSLFYVFRDIFCMVVLGFVANNYIQLLPNQFLRFAAWAGYVWCQGLFGTGIWVLAHECGHQAFSDYGWVNDLVGWILHSYLLVPYFSWKYSHGKHHKATGHISRDMVFVPKTKEEFLAARGVEDLDDLLGDTPLYSLLTLIFQQLFGWLAYLVSNVSGMFSVNHFNPNSPIFEKRDYWFILLSDLGILIQFTVLYTWYKNFGLFNFAVNYFLPYLLVNHWLVFITYLQHSDPQMPHYEASQWTFARGAAATIDREFGFVGQYIFHDIIETHVLHHYVSRIPFYNAREASECIKKVMGIHYQHSDENMWVSLWKSARWCQYVDGDNGVLMFRNTNGFGVDPKKKTH
ncbi:Delta(12) fatty acid desaturase [Candida viswanathii]|uniref:Delta(12) fatty acid desaturase n=1 Tax=Candida viswanathii TaxID=5486 RepID=A0A367XVF1_9ASCO|nr:Delta(12) fatty acid desaturase [Candida viswanathii]